MLDSALLCEELAFELELGIAPFYNSLGASPLVNRRLYSLQKNI